MNLTSSVAANSLSVNSPIASRSPEILEASGRLIGFSGRLGASANQNSNPDEASSSQGWQRDALLDMSTRRPVAADKDQKYLNHQEKISSGEPVAPGYQGYPENLQIPEDSGDSQPISRIWPHHFEILLDPWRISMWAQLCGAYLYLSHFKLQFTLDKITRRVENTQQPRNLKNIPNERVDSLENENRPSLGCQNLSSRRTL